MLCCLFFFIEKEKDFMTQKRKPPWGMFLIGLVLVLLVSYYVAGLFSLDGVTMQNYQDKLTYILLHPFRNWLNSKTSAVMGIALVAWAMFVCYYLTYYRNFHVEVLIKYTFFIKEITKNEAITE